MTDFEICLRQHVRAYPDLYVCRASLLNSLFCGSGMGQWEDGRVGERLGRKRLRAYLASILEQRNTHERETRESFSKWFKDRAATAPALRAEGKHKIADFYEKRAEEHAETPAPHEPTTVAEVNKILRNLGSPRQIAPGSIWEKDLARHRAAGTEEKFWEGYSGHTVYRGLSARDNLCTVPDDVRPDWLAGVGECIEGILRWDTPDQKEKAAEIKAELESRFGHMERWGTLQRRPSPPKKPADYSIVGRRVRLDFGDERSWAEHRPDLGKHVYRSLNDTFSGLPLRLPRGHKDLKSGAAVNGRIYGVNWGKLVLGKEKPYGNVTPTCIVGVDLSPTNEEHNRE